MNFFKNMFSKKKDGDAQSSSNEETFACENCEQTRPVSQKKQHESSDGVDHKNVCEFC